MTYSERMTNLKELLDSQHEWPGNYTFKFVVPGNKSGELRQVVAAEESHSRQSKSGKYTSMTFEIACQSSDDVISIYQKVSKIEGIVTL